MTELLFVVPCANFQPRVLICQKEKFPVEWYDLLIKNATPVPEYDIDNLLVIEHTNIGNGMFSPVQKEWDFIPQNISTLVEWGYDQDRITFEMGTPYQVDYDWSANAFKTCDHGMFDPLDVFTYYNKRTNNPFREVEGFLFLDSYDDKITVPTYRTVDELLASY